LVFKRFEILAEPVISTLEQRNYIQKLSSSDSEAAWKYLKDAFMVNNQVIGNAHELSHVVGNEIYRQHDFKGIHVCDPAFAFGCYHGVTEKVLTELGPEKINEIEYQCLEIFPLDKGGEYVSCVHGIGHGLLTLHNLDIDEALIDCDVLSESNRNYCYDGVFMEHQLSTPVSKIDPENPWEFCTNFDEQYKSSCAIYHLVELSFHFNNNISALADACTLSTNSAIRQSCLRSLGLRVSQLTRGNIQDILNLCSTVNNKSAHNTCITFAATEAIFQEYSEWQQTYKILCDSLDEDAAQNCLAYTKQMIKAYNRNEFQTLASSSISTPYQESIIESPEIRDIKKLKAVSQGTEIYRRLIERAGPAQAQEELYRSGLPFTGETHLLNHASGEYLFEKFGAAGLVQCKDYFLSSCYHGFTLELIAEEGLIGVNKVIEECQNIGITTLSQCMHAIGHGFVSWVGYVHLPKALELCDQVSSQFPNAPVFNCYDGAFMENVWGVHDGYPSPDRWIDDNDPLYPCYDSRIDKKYRLGCLANTAILMLNFFEGDLTKSGELCLSIEDSIERQGCFDNLARQIHPMTFGFVDKVYELCNTMPEDWKIFCIIRVATSDISVGGRELAFIICNRIDESKFGLCYDTILNTLSVYITNFLEFRELCNKVQDSFAHEKCINRASLSKYQ